MISKRMLSNKSNLLVKHVSKKKKGHGSITTTNNTKGLLHTCCTDCIRMRICQCEQHQVSVTDRGLIDILSFRHIKTVGQVPHGLSWMSVTLPGVKLPPAL